MVVSYVLISTAPDKDHEVYDKLSKLPDIVELHPLFGEYDLIAKLEPEDWSDVERIVTDGIRAVDGVIDTKTLIGMSFKNLLG